MRGARARPARRPGPQAGLTRAALALVVAVLAAALVLVGGAMRSSPNPSARPGVPSSGADSFELPSLPPTPTLAPTIEATAAPPEPTAVADLRGKFVGPLGHVESCPILFERDGAVELVLPSGFRSRIRNGAVEIVDAAGAVVAAEGDLIGVNGNLGGGSSCLVGPRLRVSRIIEVRHRGAE